MIMRSNVGYRPQRASRWRTTAGFTLFETIIVIGLLAFVSAGLLSMQPQVQRAQTDSRDQTVGLDLMRSCTERILAVRRNTGYSSVTSTLCSGMGGIGGFANDITVNLTDANGAAITNCATAFCTASVIATKVSGSAASLAPLTLRLYNY